MRSTFKILFYINKQKVKADGKTAILCRITIDGKSVALSTNEFIEVEKWNVKRGEASDKKVNQGLQELRQRIEEGYKSLLSQFGVVSAELLKNHLQGVGVKATKLLALSKEELQSVKESIGKSKKESTYKNNYYSDRLLSLFVQSRGEEDIPLQMITMSLFEEFHLYLKKKNYATKSINKHLCWLSRLMYKAVRQGTIRFNPFEGAKYEREEHKPRFLNKTDVTKLLAFVMNDEVAELSRRLFLFSVFTGLAFSDLMNLEISQIEVNNDRRKYIRKARQKTEVESLIPLHPIAEQILEFYINEGSVKIFPQEIKQGKLIHSLKAVGMACGISQPLTFHMARHTFGTLTLEAGIPMESIAKMMGHSSISSTQIYAQITDQKIAQDMAKLI